MKSMRANRVLDTSILIRFWRRKQQQHGRTPSAVEAARWADELIKFELTDRIVCVVFLEFAGGAGSRVETAAYEAFLARFEVVDGWAIRPEDLQLARRFARRVPDDARPRQAGDCLIAAIARRLRLTVRTVDDGFPQ